RGSPANKRNAIAISARLNRYILRSTHSVSNSTVVATNISSRSISRFARAACPASSRVTYRTRRLVSTASTPALHFRGDRLVHLLDRFRRPGVFEDAEDIFGTGRRKQRRRFQQHPFRRVLDDEARARSPAPPFPDRLRQDHLSL